MALTCAGCGKTNLDLARQCYACGHALEGLGPNSMIGQTVLGNYRLVEVLGTGGMSVVYKAQHRVTEQEVAIKILPPDLAVYDDVKARFVEEARTLAKLEHPNIVGLFNFVEADGRLHLVMQYVQGRTFEQLIAERGRVPWPEAVTIILGVLEALVYAHGRGVVHRDIKPSNILVREDGQIKVMDFGIAKITNSTRLTATGQTMGTVRYMSPEQVRGKELDGRSDLYSLGVTLYEALCGVTPFDGESHFEIMQKHLVQAIPPLSDHGVEVPKPLETALLRALQKNLDQRYADARHFRKDLLPLAPKQPSTESAPTVAAEVTAEVRLPRGRWLAAIAGIAVLAASVGAWALLRRGHGGVGTGGVDAGASEPRWPEPHAGTKDLHFAVDQSYPEARLRVMSVAQRNPDSLRDVYVRAHKAYEDYVQRSYHVSANRRPLNLVIAPAVFLRDNKRFPEATPDTSSRYEAREATLYLADLPGFEREDLPAGIAFHLCPLALSIERCRETADAFEQSFRTANP
jgi:predicted Ser/Thr protein kinase